MRDGGDASIERAGQASRAARHAMVERQLAGRGIHDRAVLAAMEEVPREAFVDVADPGAAYTDGPLPIGAGQTISQPYVVALMLQALHLRPGDRMLEVGSGSGYAAAVAGRIAAEVDAVERHELLVERSREHLARLGYANVHVHLGDGTLGLPDRAPFDAILVSAGGPSVPEALRRQVRVGGRIVIPVGREATFQDLEAVTRSGEDEWQVESLGAVQFVPLVGAEGWRDREHGDRP